MGRVTPAVPVEHDDVNKRLHHHCSCGIGATGGKKELIATPNPRFGPSERRSANLYGQDLGLEGEWLGQQAWYRALYATPTRSSPCAARTRVSAGTSKCQRCCSHCQPYHRCR